MGVMDTFARYWESSGGNRLFRFRNRHRSVVLMYHGVVPDDFPIESWMHVRESQFRLQMELLRRHYDVVGIDEVVGPGVGKKAMGKPGVVITFDDGYKNNFSVAYPILRQYRFSATIFLVSDFLDSGRMFWFDRVVCSLQKSEGGVLDLSGYDDDVYRIPSGKGEEKWAFIQHLLTVLKGKDWVQREAIVRTITGESYCPSSVRELLVPLGFDEILHMSRRGDMEFGSHTAAHEIVTGLTSEELRRTIGKSIADIESTIGKKVRYFSYPNGDYDERTIEVLKYSGIEAAFTTSPDFIGRNHGTYEIPRVGIGGYDSIETFAGKVSGAVTFLSRLRKVIGS